MIGGKAHVENRMSCKQNGRPEVKNPEKHEFLPLACGRWSKSDSQSGQPPPETAVEKMESAPATARRYQNRGESRRCAGTPPRPGWFLLDKIFRGRTRYLAPATGNNGNTEDV
jgi:hypothetical protein